MQATTRRAAYPRPLRLVAFVSTSRVLQIRLMYHNDFLLQRGTRWRDNKTDHH